MGKKTGKGYWNVSIFSGYHQKYGGNLQMEEAGAQNILDNCRNFEFNCKKKKIEEEI